MLGPFVSERHFIYSPVSPRRYDSRSLPSVVRWQYWTLGLHERGLHLNFFQVVAEQSEYSREIWQQPDRSCDSSGRHLRSQPRLCIAYRSTNRTEELLTDWTEPRKADLRGLALRNRESRWQRGRGCRSGFGFLARQREVRS
jgi:hypothetical protein